MGKHADLIKRLESGIGPDRELDADIAVLLTDDFHRRNDSRLIYSSLNIPSIEPGLAPGHYTASLDACLALQEAVLPGWQKQAMTWDHIAGYWLLLMNKEAHGRGEGIHGSEPRAWLIAILKAHEAQS